MQSEALVLDRTKHEHTEPKSLTLLNLVGALVDSGMNDGEVVWAVTELINSGRVRLVGQFREADVRVGH